MTIELIAMEFAVAILIIVSQHNHFDKATGDQRQVPGIVYMQTCMTMSQGSTGNWHKK